MKNIFRPHMPTVDYSPTMPPPDPTMVPPLPMSRPPQFVNDLRFPRLCPSPTENRRRPKIPHHYYDSDSSVSGYETNMGPLGRANGYWPPPGAPGPGLQGPGPSYPNISQFIPRPVVGQYAPPPVMNGYIPSQVVRARGINHGSGVPEQWF